LTVEKLLGIFPADYQMFSTGYRYYHIPSVF